MTRGTSLRPKGIHQTEKGDPRPFLYTSTFSPWTNMGKVGVLLWIVLGSVAWAPTVSFLRQEPVPRFRYLECSTQPSIVSTENPNTNSKVCQFCQESFESRNALFRHLQRDRYCGQKANMVTPEIKPLTLVLQFSYHNIDEAQTAGTSIQQALLQAAEQYVQTRNDGSSVVLLGSSQSSVARLRHAVLDQEEGCSAVGDTLVVRLQGPNLDLTVNNHQQEQSHRQFLEYILETTNTLLQDTTIRLEACKLSTSEKLIHAEQSCTQRVYQYLLPLRWLPDGDLLEQWWIQTSVAEIGSHTNRSTQRPPSTSLLKMKRLLRSAESDRWMDRKHNNNDINPAVPVPPTDDEDDDDTSSQDASPNVKWAAGRFGALGDKKRTAWHNFADPSLKGRASPNTKPVWRVLDRARFQVLMLVTRYDITIGYQTREYCGNSFGTSW